MTKLDEDRADRKVVRHRTRKPDDEKPQSFDEHIEAYILTGLILSSEFLERARAIWDDAYIQSSDVVIAAGWVFEYHDEYGEAPRQHIKHIWFTKMDKGFPEDRGRTIEVLLDRASDEAEKEHDLGAQNPDHLYDETLRYFRARHLEQHEEQVRELREGGRFEEAAQAVAEFELPAGNERDDGWPAPLDLQALAEQEPEEPAAIIDHWFPCGYATLYSGHGGRGKSATAMHLAACIAIGQDFFGLEVAQRRVLYLSCEDREEVLHWRLSRICRYEGIDMAELADRLDVLDLVGQDTVLFQRHPGTGIDLTASYSALATRIRELGAEVLFVDGIDDTYGGGENDRGEVKRFVNALIGLIPAKRGAVGLIGHVNKATAGTANPEGYSGSTAWHNACRARWYLHDDEQETEEGRRATGDLRLELQKSNLGQAGAAMRFRWDDDSKLFLGRLVGGNTPEERRRQERKERNAVQDAIIDVTEQGRYVPMAAQGQRTTYHVLSASPEFPDSLKTAAGRKRMRRYIEELLHQGEIVEDELHKDRRTVPILVPADE